jgi:hypothetical protein
VTSTKTQEKESEKVKKKSEKVKKLIEKFRPAERNIPVKNPYTAVSGHGMVKGTKS